MSDTTWWLVTDFDRPTSRTVTACWVEAGTAEEAADAALPYLEETWQADDMDTELETVFAVPVGERVAFDVIKAVRRSELQCCGGIGGGEHSALCRESRASSASDLLEDGDLTDGSR